MEFFWCTDHDRVEEDAGCRMEVRLGPYPTREAAERALASVAERNTRLDEQDEEWED